MLDLCVANAPNICAILQKGCDFGAQNFCKAYKPMRVRKTKRVKIKTQNEAHKNKALCQKVQIKSKKPK